MKFKQAGSLHVPDYDRNWIIAPRAKPVDRLQRYRDRFQPRLLFAAPLFFNASNTTDTNTYTSGSFDSTGCDFLEIEFSAYDSLPTITDSKSNTWVTLNSYAVAGDVRCHGVYATNVAGKVGTGHTITVTGVGMWQSAIITGWSGAHVTAPLDLQNGATTSSATFIDTGSVTPSQNDCLLISGWAIDGTPTTPALDNGFTLVAYLVNAPGANMPVAVAYKIQTTAAAVNPRWTGVTAACASAASLRSFKKSAVAPTIVLTGTAVT